MTDSTRFHRGMLYAIAERRRSFEADGYDFHVAYGRALKADPKPTRETEHAIMDFDPIFATYRWAGDMILIGMRDLILTLDGSTYKHASFLISASCAREEMARDLGEDAGRFHTMAAAFEGSAR